MNVLRKFGVWPRRDVSILYQYRRKRRAPVPHNFVTGAQIWLLEVGVTENDPDWPGFSWPYYRRSLGDGPRIWVSFASSQRARMIDLNPTYQPNKSLDLTIDTAEQLAASLLSAVYEARKMEKEKA